MTISKTIQKYCKKSNGFKIVGITACVFAAKLSDFGPSWAARIYITTNVFWKKNNILHVGLEDVVERDLFGQGARQEAQVWSQEARPADSACAEEDYDLDEDF